MKNQSKKTTTITKTFEPGTMILESAGSKGFIYVETSTGFEVRHCLKGKRPGRKIAEVLEYDQPGERLQFFEPISSALFDDLSELLEEPPFDRSFPITV